MTHEESEELIKKLAESQLAMQNAVMHFAQTADKYIEVSNARTTRLEEIVEAFLRSITTDRKQNGHS